MLILRNVKSAYRKDRLIIKGVDLHLSENETIGIIGQNGAGKSTLGKTIVNLVPHISGEIFFDGNSIIGKKTQDIIELGIGYFFQGGRIFPHLTVDENFIAAGADLSGKEFKRRKRQIIRYFDLLKEENNSRAKLQASYLSGGEKQQLALAMILIKEPKLLILDEPSAGLSPGNVKKMYEILTEIKKEKKLSILLIEQNVSMALEFGDEVFLLKNGLIEQQTINLESVEERYFD